jgi:hypothetical protein
MRKAIAAGPTARRRMPGKAGLEVNVQLICSFSDRNRPLAGALLDSDSRYPRLWNPSRRFSDFSLVNLGMEDKRVNAKGRFANAAKIGADFLHGVIAGRREQIQTSLPIPR